jgi:hypothetical protein
MVTPCRFAFYSRPVRLSVGKCTNASWEFQLVRGFELWRTLSEMGNLGPTGKMSQTTFELFHLRMRTEDGARGRSQVS